MFGLEGGLGLFVKLLVLFLLVCWLALIYWTYLDAKRRLEDPVLIACAVAASLFPFVGTVVYTIVRPPEFLEDREERELELRAAELRLRQLIEQSCPHCEYPIERNYVRCPNCERRLRNPCRKCRKPLDPKWGICPYCETEVRKARPERGERVERGRGERAERGRSERAERGRSERSRAERASRSRAQAQRLARAAREEKSGPRDGDGSGRSDRPTRRQQRQPARVSDSRSERGTGGASGSFPGTDR